MMNLLITDYYFRSADVMIMPVFTAPAVILMVPFPIMSQLNSEDLSLQAFASSVL